LHIRRNRGADQPDQEDQKIRVAVQRRYEATAGHGPPIRVGQDRRGGIGKENQRQDQEQLLNPAVRARDHQIPQSHGGHGHREVFADTEQLHRRADADELGDSHAAVGQQDDSDGEQRPTNTKALANQVEQPAASRSAKASTHFLDDGQRDRDKQ
jgi:hypothetical protein